jgi:hypothetical protein
MVGHVTKQFGDGESGSTNEAAEARFQRFLALLHTRKQLRPFQKASGALVRRLLAVTAIPIVAGFIFLQLHNTVIEADELVKFAVSAELTRPAGTTQRIGIKFTRSDKFAMSGVGLPDYTTEREMIDGIVTATTPTTVEGVPATLAERLAQRLSDHHFNFRKPFNVADFTTWRASLARRHDQVTTLSGSPQLLVLRTTTADDGDLREVELTVERDSFRVVRQVFVFDTEGTLEFQQRLHWVRSVTPPPATTVANVVAKPVRPAPVRIDPLINTQPVPQPDLASWLDRKFGNSAVRNTFMPQLRERTGSVRKRLDDLRDLSDRYPGSNGPQASLAAQARLQRDADLQYQSLRRELIELNASISTMTSAPNEITRIPVAPSSQLHAPADWSARIDTARSRANELDRLASELRAYDDLPDAVRQRLAETFSALWTAINAPAND